MGAQQAARRIQRDKNTQEAARYLKRAGYSLESALYILAAVEKKGSNSWLRKV